MKSWRFAFILFLKAASLASAIPYTGTITQTVTSSNDVQYGVGSIYTGWYQYESDTVDGTFYCIPLGYSYPGYTDSLTGNIFAGEGGESNPLNETSRVN